MRNKKILSVALAILMMASALLFSFPRSDFNFRVSAAEEKPDLVITEIKCDRANDRIGYEIQNIGKATAPGNHNTGLMVEFGDTWREVCNDDVGARLIPGDSYQSWFECYTWPESTDIRVKVCADKDNEVQESDEKNNCLEKNCRYVPPEKPDLVITNIWNEDGRICYEVMNRAELVVSENHYTLLVIDDEERAEDFISQDLGPGEYLKLCFDYECESTPPVGIITVCADSHEDVVESDETNNCLIETWELDTTPPEIIEGPSVSATTDSAVVSWVTGEDSSSIVKFGSRSGEYEGKEEKATFSRQHEVTLTGLMPSIVYHYIVQSADASENIVVSDECFFETSPSPDIEPPTISSLILSKVEGPFQLFEITTPVFDNTGVEKVEFYADGELIGVDYTGSAGKTPEYTGYLDPAGMGMSREDFLTSHELTAKAFDRSGLTTVFGEIVTPFLEPANGELEITSPHPDYTLYFDNGVVPQGTYLDIGVYACEYEYNCLVTDSLITSLISNSEADNSETNDQVSNEGDVYETPEWMQVYEPPTCYEVERAVEKVELYIDIDRDGEAEPVHTWTPSSDDDLTYTYSWDVGGLGSGSYYTVVMAYLSDGRKLTETRHIEIAREGISVDRDVVQYDNFFQVSITVINEGTEPIQLDWVKDNLTSFQAIRRGGEDFEVITHYDPLFTQKCQVDIDFFSDNSETITLDPGASKTVAYFAVPIRQVAYLDGGWHIGADEVQICYTDHTGIVENGYDMYVNPRVPPLDIIAALQGSDYLIITNPAKVQQHNSNSFEKMDELLSTMAELAKWKNGTLGYLNVSWTTEANFDPSYDGDVQNQIKWWGSYMQGSDGTPNGYLSNGYLLIVGETEIVPSGTKKMNGKSYLTDEWKPLIHCTDMYYANTSGTSFNPELMVGRIIGYTASQLISPIETSISVHKGDTGYSFDRSDAFILSGWPKSRDGKSEYGSFMLQATTVESELAEKGTDSEILDCRQFDSKENMLEAFFGAVPESDVIHLAGHGTSECFDELCAEDFEDETDPFGSANPFVYASSCSTGRYEGHYCLGEGFLEKGAAAYLGSTELSPNIINKRVAGAFYDRWDPGESISSVVKELKRDIGSYKYNHPSYGYYEDIWTAEYQFYGDPKYGLGVFPPAEAVVTSSEPQSSLEVKAINYGCSVMTREAGGVHELVSGIANDGAISGTELASPEPQSSPEVTVPDYEVTTEEGEDYVDIPGGFTMFTPSKPLVPVYDVYLDYPKGYSVQDVILTDRSSLTTTTGLNIPDFTPAIAGEEDSAANQTSQSSDWWPEKDFDWGIEKNYDGTSTIAIRIYPFYYNTMTTDVRFYKNYRFDIEVIASTVEVHELATDASTYVQGDQVSIDLWLKNSGEAQDVIITTVVVEESSDEMADGLPMHSLEGLAGLASFSYQWDSTGIDPGYYNIEVEIRDNSGSVLDREMIGLEIGIYTGELQTFTATPECFDVGDEIEIDMAFNNTGTVNINGTAVIRVQDEAGEMVQEFTHDITDLAPADSISFSDNWGTSEVEEDCYNIIGFVLYDSKATDPAVVTVSMSSEPAPGTKIPTLYLIIGAVVIIAIAISFAVIRSRKKA